MIRKKLVNGRLTIDQIQECLTVPDIIQENKDYYQGNNIDAINRYNERIIKGVKPNNYMTSPYFSTLVDSMAGYAFGDIRYIDSIKDDKSAAAAMEKLAEINGYNQTSVKNMAIALGQLGIGVSYVLHWVEMGNPKKYMFSPIDPACGFPVYDYSINGNLIAFIYKSEYSDDEYKLTVYYRDGIDVFIQNSDKIVYLESLPNDYNEIPVEIYYNDFNKDIVSLCEKVKPYINAMDCIQGGNWNEIDKGMQSILLHMSEIQQKDIDDMNMKKAWKVAVEEIGEIRFLTKEIQWEYQKFFYDLIKVEIHKHSHVIDFTDPEAGLSNTASGEAMKRRMFDMDSKAITLEQMNKIGQKMRLQLLENIGALPEGSSSLIDIEYNHATVDNTIEKITALAVDLSDRTKLELVGLDPDIEIQRKKDQEESDVSSIMDRSLNEPNTDVNQLIDKNIVDNTDNME